MVVVVWKDAVLSELSISRTAGIDGKSDNQMATANNTSAQPVRVLASVRLDTDISTTTDDRTLSSRDGFLCMKVVGLARQVSSDRMIDRNQFLW